MILIAEYIGRILVLKINRAEKRNALNTEVVDRIRYELSEAERNKKVDIIIITSASGPFSAGSDLKELAPLTPEQMVIHQNNHAALVREMIQLPLPIIAAVEEYALGGGFSLALGADIVVSSKTAMWRMPEVANGWLPPWGLTALVERIGKVRCKQILFGVPVTGDDAREFGIVDFLTEEGGALSKALEFAECISSAPSHAVAEAKRWLSSELDAERHLADDKFLSNRFIQMAGLPDAAATFERFRSK